MSLSQLLFSFKGRISRQPYWLFMFTCFLIVETPPFVLGVSNEQADSYEDIAFWILLWPLLAVQTKRWHDRDKSAWWLLVGMIPVVGWLWALIENGFLLRKSAQPLTFYVECPLSGSRHVRRNG